MPDLGLTLNAGIRVVACKTPTLPPASTTNSVFFGKKDFFVVDPATPYPEEQERFDHIVEQRMNQGHQLKAIVLSHHHHDHMGDALRVSQKFKAPLWGHGANGPLLPFKLDREITDGELLSEKNDKERFQAIFTPGHAPGHLCVFDQDSRILFAGDMITAESTVLIEPKLGNMADYLASLQKLLDLNPSTVIPSHGFPIEKGAQKIRLTLAHRHLRIEQLGALLPKEKSQALRAEDLVSAIYGQQIDELTRKLAALSLSSSLKYLAEQGKVEHDQDKLLWWKKSLN